MGNLGRQAAESLKIYSCKTYLEWIRMLKAFPVSYFTSTMEDSCLNIAFHSPTPPHSRTKPSRASKRHAYYVSQKDAKSSSDAFRIRSMSRAFFYFWVRPFQDISYLLTLTPCSQIIQIRTGILMQPQSTRRSHDNNQITCRASQIQSSASSFFKKTGHGDIKTFT